MVQWKTKFYASKAEEAEFYGAGLLFEFQGYKFVEGTDAKSTPRYLIADYTIDPTNPVYYELELPEYFNMVAYYLHGLQPDKPQGHVTLLKELERLTGKRKGIL